MYDCCNDMYSRVVLWLQVPSSTKPCRAYNALAAVLSLSTYSPSGISSHDPQQQRTYRLALLSKFEATPLRR